MIWSALANCLAFYTVGDRDYKDFSPLRLIIRLITLNYYYVYQALHLGVFSN
jgi:hypothetical protein